MTDSECCRFRLRPSFLLSLLVLVTASACAAQEDRGLITGLVTDASGAVVAGARVTAIDLATGVPTTTTTNSSGNYALLYLIPGTYSIRVEHTGFEKLVRNGIEVRVGDELKLNLQLAVGNAMQEVTVTAGAPLLEGENADIGVTMNQSQIADLPLSDGNPFILARLAPGAVYTGDPKFSRPFDNGDTSAIRVNGAEGGNQFTLNGISNMGTGSHVAYVPPSDAVQEFKMTTSTFSAQQGHGAASNINISTKSGSNNFHGTVYEFFRNEKLSANDFFRNRARQPRDVVRYNRFGGTLGGPVILPKLYNGRKKTFFFFAYENLPDVFPEPKIFTVPTTAERKGDFSALLPTIAIYDPNTAQDAGGGHVTRSQFVASSNPNSPDYNPACTNPRGCANIIPLSRLDPIALNYLKYYPLPNQPADDQGLNNFSSAQPRTDKFHSMLGRIDHVLSSNQRLAGTYFYNWREEVRFDWAGIVNGIRPTGQDLFRVNHGISLDDAITVSPTMLLDLRGGFTRFVEQTLPTTMGFKPSQLGFSPAVTGLFLGKPFLPQFTIDKFSSLSRDSGNSNFYNVYSFAPTLTKIMGTHNLSIGYDFRVYRENRISLGHSGGQYDFKADFTRRTDTSTSLLGQGLAAFLLGQPTGGKIESNATRANQGLFHAGFVQDDWKITSKLTLNLGLRYEYEGATTERYNRNIRGFDLTDPNPINPAAQAAFFRAFRNGQIVSQGGTCGPSTAPTPCPFTISIPDLQILGGYQFADSTRRGFWHPDPWNFQPRFGFAYQFAKNTVVRGGWAIYSVPFDAHSGLAGVNQAGFSQSTPLVPSNDNGLNFQATLANPFPNGVLNPPGSSLGMATGVGQDISFMQLDPKTGLSQRWSLDIQRELPGQWLIDVAYVGSRGYQLDRTSNYLDAVPSKYLSTSPLRDQATINELQKQIANPFKGLAPGASFNTNNTIQLQQLLRPFPEFTKISTALYDGTNNFHAGELRVEHRFRQGYGVFATYTWSKLSERFGFLNDFETEPTKRLSGNDVPHRFTSTFIGQVPFGRGRRWGGDLQGWVNAVLGGWQTQWIYQIQSGMPIGMGNLVYFGDPSKLRTHNNGSTVDHTFDTTGFYFTDAPVQTNGMVDRVKQRNDPRIHLENNVRTFPNILPNFRQQGQNNIDLSFMKKFSLMEKTTLELRGEFLNAFNHPWFKSPNVDPRNSDFAKIKEQRNLPREVQLAMKIVF